MANGTTQTTWNPWANWGNWGAAATTPGYGWGAGAGANQALMFGNQAATTPAVPQVSWFPWGTEWGSTPWAGVDKDTAKQQMAWMNVALPWLQAQVQGQQWGQEFDWRKAQDEWQKAFQESQFEHQKAADVWSQEFQQKQMEEQLAAQEEQTAMQTFGRRWKPQTRWM